MLLMLMYIKQLLAYVNYLILYPPYFTLINLYLLRDYHHLANNLLLIQEDYHHLFRHQRTVEL